MRRYIYETLHPEIYHGYGKKSPYFEGWYYKLISADERTRYAVIPGVFYGQNDKKDHAFVQVLDGMTGKATYHEYPVGDFWADEEVFDVRVGPNRFRRDCLALDIDDELRSVYGELRLGEGHAWPVSIREPGVMGWYAWLPFMECYHGILSFDHGITGSLAVDGQRLDFTGGRGYMEKDWGQAFPEAYVWHQSNHFDTPHTSLVASIALIPSVGRTFAGFLAGFYHHRKLYRMTTYTGAQVERLDITDDKVFYTLRDRRYRLAMISERRSGGLLKAPIRTEMHKRVDETMQSTIDVRFSELDGTLIYEGQGRNAALEVHGKLDDLVNLA
jgi:tocopherol cyclase